MYAAYNVNEGKQDMEMTPIIAVSRKMSWTDAQRREFGRRLTLAQKKAGYATVVDAMKVVQRHVKIKVRTVYSHFTGARAPESDKLMEIYARVFDIPVGYLLLEQDEPYGALWHEAAVNQAVEAFTENSSHIPENSYISILTARDIHDLVNGKPILAIESRERLVVPLHIASGPNVIAFQIPAFDYSMVSPDNPSFGPGNHLVIDPDADVPPGKYVLCLPAGAEEPLVRRLEAPFAYVPGAPRYPFTLTALNPLVKPLLVTSAEDCWIAGRVISIIQSV